MCYICQLSQDEVVGMLHEEELALRRALYASLHGSKSPVKSESPGKSTITEDCSQPSSSTTHHHSPSPPDVSPAITPQKRIKVRSPSPTYECVSPNFSSGLESSPAQGVFGLPSSSLSSPIGSPGSIGSSLRLVLSTSSWSSSTSSNWSSEPSSPYAKSPPRKIPKKRLKQKGDALSQKTPPKGKGKKKLTVDCTLFGQPSPATPKKMSPKIKRMPEKESKISSKLKKPNSNKTALKVKLHKPAPGKKSPKVLAKKKKRVSKQKPASLSQEQDDNPLSPEAAAVIHDHCYASTKGSIPPNEVKPKDTGQSTGQGTDQAMDSTKGTKCQQQSASALW